MKPDDLIALNNLAFNLAEHLGRPQDALPYAQRAYTLGGRAGASPTRWAGSTTCSATTIRPWRCSRQLPSRRQERLDDPASCGSRVSGGRTS